MEDVGLQKAAKWIMESSLMRIIRRFLPLFTACWMIADITLDINQTITFYRLYGFEGQGSYETWAIATTRMLQTVLIWKPYRPCTFTLHVQCGLYPPFY